MGVNYFGNKGVALVSMYNWYCSYWLIPECAGDTDNIAFNFFLFS